MYVARWHMTARVGQREACIALLRKWQIDVGYRIGWKPGSLRVAAGAIGAGEGDIEIEVELDSLADLEASWSDMDSVPYHKQYMRDLEALIVSGSVRWIVHRIVDLAPEG